MFTFLQAAPAAQREKIMSLPDDTALYSGHGDASTVLEERLNNPHLKNL